LPFSFYSDGNSSKCGGKFNFKLPFSFYSDGISSE
jgi:hypothetical protein